MAPPSPAVQIFRSLEAEAAKRAQRADLAIAPFRQMRLAGVLEHRQFVLAADLEDGVEIRGRAADVHRQDAARALGDGGFDLARVNLRSFRIRVNEHRHCVLQQHRVDRGHERVRRHDHFVAGADAESIQRNDQGARTVGGGQAVLRSQRRGPGFFELARVVAIQAVPLPLAQHLHPGALFVFGDDRP